MNPTRLNMWRKIVQSVSAPVCQLCGAPGLGPDICRGCFRDLPRPGYACRRCALPLGAPGCCGPCLSSPPGFDAACAPFLYAFPVDRLLKSLKYDTQLKRARLCGELLGHAVRHRRPRPDVLVPVPLHRRRWRQRGFNQARELAVAVRRVCGLPLLDAVCARVRDTPPLWDLPPARRRLYLRGAFHVAADLRGLNVAVVDDVLTTGATADALARTLCRSGASRVEIWTVARALGAHAAANV